MGFPGGLYTQKSNELIPKYSHAWKEIHFPNHRSNDTNSVVTSYPCTFGGTRISETLQNPSDDDLHNVSKFRTNEWITSTTYVIPSQCTTHPMHHIKSYKSDNEYPQSQKKIEVQKIYHEPTLRMHLKKPWTTGHIIKIPINPPFIFCPRNLLINLLTQTFALPLRQSISQKYHRHHPQMWLPEGRPFSFHQLVLARLLEKAQACHSYPLLCHDRWSLWATVRTSESCKTAWYPWTSC